MGQLSMFDDNEAWHAAPPPTTNLLGVTDADSAQVLLVERQIDGGARITIQQDVDDSLLKMAEFDLTADSVVELVRYLKRKADPNE